MKQVKYERPEKNTAILSVDIVQSKSGLLPGQLGIDAELMLGSLFDLVVPRYSMKAGTVELHSQVGIGIANNRHDSMEIFVKYILAPFGYAEKDEIDKIKQTGFLPKTDLSMEQNSWLNVKRAKRYVDLFLKQKLEKGEMSEDYAKKAYKGFDIFIGASR